MIKVLIIPLITQFAQGAFRDPPAGWWLQGLSRLWEQRSYLELLLQWIK